MEENLKSILNAFEEDDLIRSWIKSDIKEYKNAENENFDYNQRSNFLESKFQLWTSDWRNFLEDNYDESVQEKFKDFDILSYLEEKYFDL